MERFETRPSIKYESLPISFAARNSDRVLEALFIATQVHEGDKRKLTGEPYIHHCIAVADILSSWGADEDEVVAGLLHDTVEDHSDIITVEDIKQVFGERVAFLVDGVTKMKSREEDKNEFETLRKVTRESLIEPGVALVKLADRLHNMLTLGGMKPSTQITKAKETLAVYAPLAESFGLWQIKNALEDLSFMYINPQKYKEVREQLDRDPRLDENFIKEREMEIKKELEEYGISARVEHQVGGYWEISDKQRRSAMRSGSKPKNFSEITDVISFRVVVEDGSLADCYKVMGIMRMKYKDKIEKQRHDDYLLCPATNGYSALHDSYKFTEGSVEIAVTTSEKESFNNWGVVSLSREELMANRDKYSRKLIFTPKEELVFIEPKATGIDIAYKLNPSLGLKAVGVLADGVAMELSDIIHNVSLVEIVVDSLQTRPKQEWLTYCNEETRRVIEQQIMISDHDEEVDKGKRILADVVLRERGLLSLDDLDPGMINGFLLDLGCWYGLSDLYYKIAYGMDIEAVRRGLDDIGLTKGLYSTIEVKGKNRIGVSSEIASLVAKYGGDTRIKIEKVDKDENFLVRVIMMVDGAGKKQIEEDLKNRFLECIVV